MAQPSPLEKIGPYALVWSEHVTSNWKSDSVNQLKNIPVKFRPDASS